jgi:CRP-like cAMP-binding protein
MDDRSRIELFLASSRLFGGLPAGDLRQVALTAQLAAFGKKSAVYREGTPADRFFIILAGKVKIVKTGDRGREQLLRFILPGEAFGEDSLFGGKPYPADAVAAQDAELISFPRDSLLALLKKNPELSLRMLGIMARSCREFMDLLENLSLRKVPSRVAAYILAVTHNKLIKAGDTVNLGSSKGELASRLGIAGETLSRALRRLREEGIISTSGREVKILDPEKLRRLVSRTDE